MELGCDSPNHTFTFAVSIETCTLENTRIFDKVLSVGQKCVKNENNKTITVKGECDFETEETYYYVDPNNKRLSIFQVNCDSIETLKPADFVNATCDYVRPQNGRFVNETCVVDGKISGEGCLISCDDGFDLMSDGVLSRRTVVKCKRDVLQPKPVCKPIRF
ncbi:hypothetical protein MHBO_002396 [Bonamia ostreae]|uniref:Sushi domain-containing protein n=1 Tax=Bonamia ostreae TaxID=126728 RepID=A0ABV2AM92_9EUKA